MPFSFEMPLSVFQKADAEPGKERRIGGIASLETKDRQGEILLQRGLDFEDFLSNGWFNDNHSRETTGILGYPEQVKFFGKGSKLPNGEVAPANGHWVEGYLLDTPAATKVWDLAQSLAKTKRRLGLSVEGKIEKRQGPLQKVVAKAIVRNVAITNCPVNTGAKMDILAKSLSAMRDPDDDEELEESQDEFDFERALMMGPAHPGQAIQGGVGAGQVLAYQSLESQYQPPHQIGGIRPKKKNELHKAMTEEEAYGWLRAQLPNATPEQLGRIITLTHEMCGHEGE